MTLSSDFVLPHCAAWKVEKKNHIKRLGNSLRPRLHSHVWVTGGSELKSVAAAAGSVPDVAAALGTHSPICSASEILDVPKQV